MELSLLEKALALPNAPRLTVLACCRSLGYIPPQYRGQVYKALLNVDEAKTLEALNKKPTCKAAPSADRPEIAVEETDLHFQVGRPLCTPSKAHSGSPDEIVKLSARGTAGSSPPPLPMDAAKTCKPGEPFGDTPSSSPLPNHRRSSPVSPLAETPRSLPNQRVVRADSERTRGDTKTVERLLTHYCLSNDIKYKQGLNELLAPFLSMSFAPDTDQELQTYCCFVEFIKKFLPTNVYADDGFSALQCCFRCFRLLLLYHAPKLCKLLDGQHLPPELYASGWFLTLFAQVRKKEAMQAIKAMTRAFLQLYLQFNLLFQFLKYLNNLSLLADARLRDLI